MLFLIIWLLSGILGALIGQSKNRTAEGAALGFVLGIIGLVIILCLKPKPAAVVAPQATAAWAPPTVK